MQVEIKKKKWPQFCSWLAKTYNVSQMLPVRGHSFGQCDRNFCLINSSIKTTKCVIETPEPYYEAIQTCLKTPSLFSLIHGHEMIYDWKKAFEPFFFYNSHVLRTIFWNPKVCHSEMSTKWSSGLLKFAHWSFAAFQIYENIS